MKSNRKQLKDLQSYLVPGLVIIASLFLTIFSFNYHWGIVSETRSNISIESKQQVVLEERLSTLRTVQVEVENSSNIVTSALPQNNPAILIISNLKSLASENEVLIEDLRINSASGGIWSEDLNTAIVSVTVSGNYEGILEFIDKLQTISPIVNLSSLSLSQGNSGELSIDVSLYGFYSDLPKELPAIDTPLAGLSDTEKGIISVLKDNLRPTLQSGVFSNEEKGRENPFEL